MGTKIEVREAIGAVDRTDRDRVSPVDAKQRHVGRGRVQRRPVGQRIVDVMDDVGRSGHGGDGLPPIREIAQDVEREHQFRARCPFPAQGRRQVRLDRSVNDGGFDPRPGKGAGELVDEHAQGPIGGPAFDQDRSHGTDSRFSYEVRLGGGEIARNAGFPARRRDGADPPKVRTSRSGWPAGPSGNRTGRPGSPTGPWRRRCGRSPHPLA